MKTVVFTFLCFWSGCFAAEAPEARFISELFESKGRLQRHQNKFEPEQLLAFARKTVNRCRPTEAAALSDEARWNLIPSVWLLGVASNDLGDLSQLEGCLMADDFQLFPKAVAAYVSVISRVGTDKVPSKNWIPLKQAWEREQGSSSGYIEFAFLSSKPSGIAPIFREWVEEIRARLQAASAQEIAHVAQTLRTLQCAIAILACMQVLGETSDDDYAAFVIQEWEQRYGKFPEWDRLVKISQYSFRYPEAMRSRYKLEGIGHENLHLGVGQNPFRKSPIGWSGASPTLLSEASVPDATKRVSEPQVTIEQSSNGKPYYAAAAAFILVLFGILLGLKGFQGQKRRTQVSKNWI